MWSSVRPPPTLILPEFVGKKVQPIDFYLTGGGAAAPPILKTVWDPIPPLSLVEWTMDMDAFDRVSSVLQ